MITSKIIANGLLRALAITVGCCLLLYFLYQIQTVLLYLFISLIVSTIATPMVDFLKRRCKFKHTPAVITVLVFMISMLVGFIMMFVPLIISQGQNLSLLDTHQMEQDFSEMLLHIKSYLSGYNIDTDKLIKQADLTSNLNLSFIPNFINILINVLSGFGIGLASVVFITFFFLKDKELFKKSVKKILPDAHEEKIINSFRKTNHMLSRYFIGLIVQMSCLFVCYLIVLLIFGVDNAFIIAFITALLNIIPYIGPLISSILVIVLTLLGNIGPESQGAMLSTTLYVFIGYCVAQFIDNNITSPLIFSNSVNSHPLEIFIVILASGFLFGILGMIIAIPLYTTIKVVAKEFFPENPVVKILTKDL